MNTLELEVLVLVGLVLLVGAGVIEMLKRIEKAIVENYQASLARAMTTMDVAVTPEKEKVVNACKCGHALTDHNPRLPTGPGTVSGITCRLCDCSDYKPKRGPWPGELKV